MYGKYVMLEVGEIDVRIFVLCTPQTPDDEVIAKARKTLEFKAHTAIGRVCR